MTTRSAAPFAGIDWLKNAVGLVRKDPWTLVGAGLLLILLALVPTAVSLVMQFAMPGSLTVAYVTLGLSLAMGLLMAPLTGGYLQLIDSIERGGSPRPSAIFAPFREGGSWLRLMGFAVLLMVVTLGILALTVAGLGSSFFGWYANAVSNPGAGAPLPAGFWSVIAAIVVVSLLACGVWAIGYGQVAVGGRGPLAALRDGTVGTVKNVVPFLVLLVAAIVAYIAIMIVLLLIGGLFSLLGLTLVSLVVLIPLYICLLLVMYPLTFGVMYYLWRDVCGQDRAAMAQTLA